MFNVAIGPMAACVLAAAVAHAGEITGSGRWQSTNADPVKGKWSVVLTLAKDEVRRTMTLDGSNVFTGGEVQGILAEGQIVLGVFEQGSKVASFAGKVDGDAVKGEWSCGAVADEGVWEGTLTGIAQRSP